MKFRVFAALFIISIIFASVYGMIHNQISFTVSPEYFTKFKFIQFCISTKLQNRIGASVVGLRATWWMGLMIGLILVPLGLVIPGWRNFLFGMLRVFSVVTGTAFLTGIIALIYGYFVLNNTNIPNYLYFDQAIDPVAFARAGNMHNFSYLGGLIGIITGGIWIFVERALAKKRL
ncbi:MAG TPA: hypothetical protein VHY08_27685 [Bacillota bacterium]|nr:hypothetical protein [Bacillota bacterium]